MACVLCLTIFIAADAIAAWLNCIMCGWIFYDPSFKKETRRYFPTDSADKRIEWQQENSGYDLYEPRGAACLLGISTSFLRYSGRNDSTAPVIMGWGVIACDTPALQVWWGGRQHYNRQVSQIGRVPRN